ncbi:ABC transporter ATP-binding protein/permease [Marinobacterium sp. D7]|uniref:ABC transporter transmembrane domain-containing protein n=1 Tax=Marinobacterium ramblicola TaxID=2849041 RepID=UPI001C2D0ABD|nr:ABC transporter ATP-binding protein [Marinobacterium ramblicola]MBV1786825.1 ABC transporter ATP-binding protein/permease [Marinobacterium ramblicola]
MLPSVLASNLRARLLGLLICSGLMLSAALASLVLLTRRLGGTAPTGDSLYPLLGILLALVVLACGRFVERYAAEVMAQDYVHELRQMVLAHALNLPARHNGRIAKGGTLLRLTGDMGAVRNWIVQGIAPMVVLGTWLIASMIALAFLHWSLVAAITLPLLLSVFVNYRLGRRLYRVSEAARLKRTHLIRNVTEKLAAIDVVRSFNQLGRESRRFDRQGARLRDALNRRARVSGLLRGANEAAVLITLVILVLVGQQLVSRSILTQADFSLMLIAAIYLLANLRRLSRIYELWTLNRVASDKLEHFLSIRIPPRIKASGKMRRSERAPLTLIGAAIPGRLMPVDAALDTRDRVLLSGPGGSGKTTLLRMLAGLESGIEGRIELDGVSQRKIEPKAWSKVVALVSNDLPLLRGTVHGNLFYGRRQYDETYYAEVLRLCGLEHAIEAELSPDTALIEGGANLSSSNRYRLMLARAMLRRPRYLLLDSHEAHQDQEIIAVLIEVLSRYRGGVLICTNLAELQPHCTQSWQLTADRGFSVRQLRLPAQQSEMEVGYVV